MKDRFKRDRELRYVEPKCFQNYNINDWIIILSNGVHINTNTLLEYCIGISLEEKYSFAVPYQKGSIINSPLGFSGTIYEIFNDGDFTIEFEIISLVNAISKYLIKNGIKGLSEEVLEDLKWLQDKEVL